jgi:hypothetical protein
MGSFHASDPWTWLRRVFPVKTYHTLEKVPDLPEAVRLPSGASFEPFAWWDSQSSCWRTWQRCLVEEWEQFSGPWPRSGMTRNGIAYRRAPLVPLTDGTGFGLLPTPSGTSNHGQNHVSGRLDEWGGSSNPWRGTEIGKIHSPRFEEWMMGYPDRWTEPMDAETPSSRKCQN